MQLSAPTSLPFPRVEIGSFRGLEGLSLEDCGPVNLLVGGNNSGKTSVLEALLLLSSPVDVRQWDGAVELRSTWPLADLRFRGSGIERLDALTWLFPHIDGELGPIDLRGGGPIEHVVATAERIMGEPPERPVIGPEEVIEGGARHLRVGGRAEGAPVPVPGLVIDMSLLGERSNPSLFDELHQKFRMVLWQSGRAFRVRSKVHGPAIPVAFASPISHRSDGYLATRVGRLLRTKRKAQALDLLRELDPRVTDLVLVTPEEYDSDSAVPRGGGRASLHVEYEGTGLVPVHAMGDGMRRALHFAVLVAETGQGGVLLVDEIEVGMHTSVLRGVFQWLCTACRSSGVQLFATTHSLEAADAMLVGIPDEDLVLYRIRNSRARRFEGSLLRVSRMELGQEVR